MINRMRKSLLNTFTRWQRRCTWLGTTQRSIKIEQQQPQLQSLHQRCGQLSTPPRQTTQPLTAVREIINEAPSVMRAVSLHTKFAHFEQAAVLLIIRRCLTVSPSGILTDRAQSQPYPPRIEETMTGHTTLQLLPPDDSGSDSRSIERQNPRLSWSQCRRPGFDCERGAHGRKEVGAEYPTGFAHEVSQVEIAWYEGAGWE